MAGVFDVAERTLNRWKKEHADFWQSLTRGRAAADADVAANLGLTRLRASTLRKRVLAGDRAGARREIVKWVRGGGRVLPGLVARRNAEAALI